jgi:hypothetical protein
MTKLKTRKNRSHYDRARKTAARPSRQVSGVVLDLGGGFGSTVRIANAQVDTIAAKVNNALTSGKLVKFGNEWVNPKSVIQVSKSTWTEYPK